jgi:hypothetical protein
MKKNLFITTIMIALTITTLFAQGVTPQPPANYGQPGAGLSEANPYLIANLANLRWLSETTSVWGTTASPRYYKQTEDIDATETMYWNSGQGFSPIGRSTQRFNGVYNGNEKTISNLHININTTTTIYSGLFGCVDTSTIKNVFLVNNSFNAISTQSVHIGGIVGYARNSTIENSYSTGNVSSSSSGYAYAFAGGLVGISSGTLTIENSYSTGNVSSISSGYAYAGGLVGYVNYYTSLTIENSYSTGNVSSSSSSSSSYSYAGGLVGYVDYYTSLTIENSYSTGNVSSSSSTNNNAYAYAGGLVGFNNSTLTI